jgi:hypothetical protein
LWAARKIAAFTDDEIRAIVSIGQYSDRAAEEWVARCLIERRRKIVKAFLGAAGGLDRFQVRDNRLDWTYDGEGEAPRAQAQWSVFDNRTGQRQFLPGASTPELPSPVEPSGYLIAEITGGSGPAVWVYIRTAADRKYVVGVERHFAADTRK